MLIAEPLQRAIEELSKFPGIGKKSAQRIALHLLRKDDEDFSKLVVALTQLRNGISYCKICYNLTEKDICVICANEKRDKSILCIVEDVGDIVSIEKANVFSGVYHVLGGLLAPLKGVYREHLRISQLVERIKSGSVNEVIFALNPNTEGDTTTVFLQKILSDFPIKITRIARGIPVGGDLEFSDEATISRALSARDLLI